MRFVILLLIFFSMGTLHAQTSSNELGQWTMYLGTFRVSDRWSIQNEVHWRNYSLKPNTEQWLLQLAANYHLNDGYFLTGGYGYMTTHPNDLEDKTPFAKEHRLWEQFQMRNQLGRLTFENRYRLEQRWINSELQHRIRYRILTSIPINHSSIIDNTLFIALWNELHINPAAGKYFERNWLYGALGYRFTGSISIQFGALRHFITASGKNYLQFALFFTPDFRTAEPSN